MSPPIRILVVDDEVPQMRALCDTLSDHEFVTTGFSSSQKALEHFKNGQYDLLLTDLMMPGMDGIAFLQAVQRLDPNVIGILMTGAGTIATAIEAMKAGAFDYLLKPFKLSELLPVLSRALKMRQLRQENIALQEGMRQRTIELEEANRELETFSYSVSHDLRAPLRSINGFSHALIDDASASLTAENREHLNRIVSATARMGQLIDDLLSLSQFSRGAVRRSLVDLTRIAHEVISRLKGQNPERSGSFCVQDGLTAQCDPGLLAVVLENLLGNAWKFTRNQPQPYIVFNRTGDVYQVQDNGAGFDMANASNLFGAFQRLHARSDFEGTGIGLATVQRIIHRHGGRISAHGEVGQGATFSFTLDAGSVGVSPSGAT